MTALHILAPAGVEVRGANVRLARKCLQPLGFEVTLDASLRVRHQCFAGDDDTRLATLHRVADAAPSIAMPSRGGYGTTRLLDRIDGRESRTVWSRARAGWASATSPPCRWAYWPTPEEEAATAIFYALKGRGV